MNNFSDYKIDARLRLFGDIDDRSLVEGHDRMAAEATVGPDQRWVLYDPANEALPEDHPILLIRPYNVEDAVRLRYEVRGWSHLKAAPGTLLDEGDFKIDLRLSLIIHFYANGRIPST